MQTSAGGMALAAESSCSGQACKPFSIAVAADDASEVVKRSNISVMKRFEACGDDGEFRPQTALTCALGAVQTCNNCAFL